MINLFPLSEFSESLMEMGNCLLEKTAIHDDGERGEQFSGSNICISISLSVENVNNIAIMAVFNSSINIKSKTIVFSGKLKPLFTRNI